MMKNSNNSFVYLVYLHRCHQGINQDTLWFASLEGKETIKWVKDHNKVENLKYQCALIKMELKEGLEFINRYSERSNWEVLIKLPNSVVKGKNYENSPKSY